MIFLENKRTSGKGRSKRCKTASELVERHLEMMDSISPESRTKKLGESTNLKPLGNY